MKSASETSDLEYILRGAMRAACCKMMATRKSTLFIKLMLDPLGGFLVDVPLENIFIPLSLCEMEWNK